MSELVAMERFSRAGYFLYLPLGDAAPADLVLIDRNDRLFRIQVKTGRIRNGAVLFSCVSNHGHRKQPPTQYVGRIDAFAVY
ncbi:MAG: group I intron-associated PD-(D/E)XK endonuclease, partial [Vulcanimicrobiaceae bacterium]